MKADIVVLGAGAIGTAAALHLQRRGRAVILIDRKDPGEETSHGNAGLIERATIEPYAFPRQLGRLLRYALNNRADVRYDPLYLPQILPWLARYWWRSAPDRIAQSARALYPLIYNCLETHAELAELANSTHLIAKGGWIELLLSDAARQDAMQRAEKARASELEVDFLDAAALHRKEPALLNPDATGLHWTAPWLVTDPGALVKSWAAAFQNMGGTFLRGDADTARFLSGRWTVQTANGEVTAPEIVVALGPWSGEFARRFGHRLPMAVKRGYHMEYAVKDGVSLSHPLLDEDSGFVLSPINGRVRLTTGIEFGHPAAPPNDIQLRRAEARARRLIPLGERLLPQPWLGLRPCFPDMLPVIGPVAGAEGLWFCFGHAHHGLTLGPATGKLLAQMMLNERPFADPGPFRVDRFHP